MLSTNYNRNRNHSNLSSKTGSATHFSQSTAKFGNISTSAGIQVLLLDSNCKHFNQPTQLLAFLLLLVYMCSISITQNSKPGHIECDDLSPMAKHILQSKGHQSSGPVFIKHRPKTSSGSTTVRHISKYATKQMPRSQPADKRARLKAPEHQVGSKTKQRKGISKSTGTSRAARRPSSAAPRPRGTSRAAGRPSSAAPRPSALRMIIKHRDHGKNGDDKEKQGSAPKTITIGSKAKG